MKRTKGKYAYGFCDRTGFRYPIHELVPEFVQGHPTGLMVGYDVADPDHEQNWLGKLAHYSDPQALQNPRPDLAERDSRKQFAWDPVGKLNLVARGYCGDESLSTGRVTIS